MHTWGDDWEHWDTLYLAEKAITSFVRHYGFCYVMSKEKYGSIRWEQMIPKRGMPHRLALWWGTKVFRYAMRTVIKHHPEIEDELLQDGCFWMGDEEIVNKYWRSI